MNPTPTPNSAASAAKTVLIVDDFASVRFYHANLLRSAGYRCVDARDGFEAFEKLRLQAIDLILLDLIMPKMSGEEFIKRIRVIPELSTIPILVISSESVEDKIRQITGTGRFGFAIKPLTPNVLLESAKKLLA